MSYVQDYLICKNIEKKNLQTSERFTVLHFEHGAVMSCKLFDRKNNEKRCHLEQVLTTPFTEI